MCNLGYTGHLKVDDVNAVDAKTQLARAMSGGRPPKETI